MISAVRASHVAHRAVEFVFVSFSEAITKYLIFVELRKEERRMRPFLGRWPVSSRLPARNGHDRARPVATSEQIETRIDKTTDEQAQCDHREIASSSLAAARASASASVRPSVRPLLCLSKTSCRSTDDSFPPRTRPMLSTVQSRQSEWMAGRTDGRTDGRGFGERKEGT